MRTVSGIFFAATLAAGDDALRSATSLSDLAGVPAPTVSRGTFDPNLMAVEEACSRDYSAACPTGFTSAGGNSCQATESYSGPCNSDVYSFESLSTSERRAWANHCSAQWPCTHGAASLLQKADDSAVTVFMQDSHAASSHMDKVRKEQARFVSLVHEIADAQDASFHELTKKNLMESSTTEKYQGGNAPVVDVRLVSPTESQLKKLVETIAQEGASRRIEQLRAMFAEQLRVVKAGVHNSVRAIRESPALLQKEMTRSLLVRVAKNRIVTGFAAQDREQAERIQEVTEQGKKLLKTLTRHVQESLRKTHKGQAMLEASPNKLANHQPFYVEVLGSSAQLNSAVDTLRQHIIDEATKMLEKEYATVEQELAGAQ